MAAAIGPPPPAAEAPTSGLKTYVQAVAKGVVSLFKILLRYPVDINCEKGFVFSKGEMMKAIEEIRFALVLKFVHSRPLIDDIRLSMIKTWGLHEIPVINFMDEHHVLIIMQSEQDFMHGWAKEGRSILGYGFRMFRWTKNFDLRKESPLAQ